MILAACAAFALKINLKNTLIMYLLVPTNMYVEQFMIVNG